MAITPYALHQAVEHHEGEFTANEINQLTGLLRYANDGTDIVTRKRVEEDLGQYADPAASRRRMFIARVAFDNFSADMEITGFATTQVDPETGGHHIDRLFIHPVSRGRQLGRQLVQACVDVAAEAAPYIQYDRVPASSAEHAVFSDLGFEPSSSGVPRLALDQ